MSFPPPPHTPPSSVVQFGQDLRAHCETDVIEKLASIPAFKCYGKEELAENVSLHIIPKRVSWDPTPYDFLCYGVKEGITPPSEDC